MILILPFFPYLDEKIHILFGTNTYPHQHIKMTAPKAKIDITAFRVSYQVPKLLWRNIGVLKYK